MARFQILAMTIDARRLDDETLPFVRNHLRKHATSIDAVVEGMQVLGKSWPTLAIDMVVLHGKQRRLLRLSHGWVTNQSPEADERLTAILLQRGMHERLPPNGYTQRRLDEVMALRERFDHASVPKYIEYLRYSTSGASLENELRRTTYDALTHYATEQVRSLLLDALRSEPDEIADAITDGLWRQQDLTDELPKLIDRAWRPPRDERLARRLLRALVKSDDDYAHKAWVLANYRVLLLSTGVSYES